MIPKILTPNDDSFPNPEVALTEPNGLLAIGGDLSVERLLSAYRAGIFPWYGDDQPILWWSPDPRGVLFLDNLHVPRRLRTYLKARSYTITLNQAFESVIRSCALPRPTQPQTWLTAAMIDAYCRLFEAGYAQSLEVWRNQQLVGGIYGVPCGRVFTGESLFGVESNIKKIAFISLAQHLQSQGFQILDCQITTPFLAQFGVVDLPRNDFIELLARS